MDQPINHQEWAARFASHIINELRDPIGPEDAWDWAYDVFPENASQRPEDVAQREWLASVKGYERDLQALRDEQRAEALQKRMF